VKKIKIKYLHFVNNMDSCTMVLLTLFIILVFCVGFGVGRSVDFLEKRKEGFEDSRKQKEAYGMWGTDVLSLVKDVNKLVGHLGCSIFGIYKERMKEYITAKAVEDLDTGVLMIHCDLFKSIEWSLFKGGYESQILNHLSAVNIEGERAKTFANDLMIKIQRILSFIYHNKCGHDNRIELEEAHNILDNVFENICAEHSDTPRQPSWEEDVKANFDTVIPFPLEMEPEAFSSTLGVIKSVPIMVGACETSSKEVKLPESILDDWTITPDTYYKNDTGEIIPSPYDAKYNIIRNKDILRVERIDKDSGWGADLVLMAFDQ